jgi:multiple sugar transport system substrate-binding protein
MSQNRFIYLALSALVLSGCGGDQPVATTRPFDGAKIRVATTDDPAILDLIRSRRDEWSQSSGAEIELVAMPLKPSDVAAQADVVLFLGDRIGDLVDADAIAPIADAALRQAKPIASNETPTPALSSRDAAPFDLNEIAQPLRERAGRYGDDRVAIPVGASAFVLVYRRDAFDNPKNQAAAKDLKLDLTPPKTWDALERLAAFFQNRDWNDDGQPDSGIAAPFGSHPDGDALFISIAATLALPPDYLSFLFDLESLDPLVASPPFIKAIESLKSLHASAPKVAQSMDPTAARDAFRNGQTALLIDRAEFAPAWTNPKKPVPISVALLPASSRYYDPDRNAWLDASPPNAPPILPSGGGWFAAISRDSNPSTHAAAIDFIRFLCGREMGQNLAAELSLPMLPTRISQIVTGLPDPRAAIRVDSTAWAHAVEDTLANPRALPSLRIPDSAGYMADLAKTRTETLAGRDPAEALAALKSAWIERTKQLGTDRQGWHYRRSLNRVTATPKPPPRG